MSNEIRIFKYMNLIRKSLYLSAIVAFIIVSQASCVHEPPKPVQPAVDPAATQYPLEIANIFINKCATAGCHNEASFSGAGGLRMDDWQYLFDGGSSGAAVVPYSPENSPMLYFLNPAPNEYDFISVQPTMPYNQSPLSKEEYDLIKKWITDGAPDKNGNVPFASNPDARQKAYMTQQGCDLLTVIDAEKNVVMRYVKVGSQPNIESPHYVQIDKQGKYAYICFTGGTIIQKIDASTDKVVGEIDLKVLPTGGDRFNIVQVSDDGKKLIASQLQSSVGNLIVANTESMSFQVIAALDNPHGIAPNKTFDTFYVTGQYGNTVFRVAANGNKQSISIDGKPPVTVGDTSAYYPNPHEIIMAPDYSKYFLSCEKTNEVRVMDRLGDTLLKVIPVGIRPQELAISNVQPYLFVTCMDDVSNLSALYKGSIYVINYNTLEVVKRIDGTFYRPHGVTVDDKNGTFYVASQNDEPNGPDPHHISNCNGRNGYYQVYDINTLKPINGRRYEVPPSPYSLNMRFKN